MSCQLTTETGCTIKVVLDETGMAVVLVMAPPGDLRQVLVLLTKEERAQLKGIL